MDANLTANLLSSKFRPLNEETSISQGSSSDSQIPKCINFKSASNHVEAQDLATRLLFEIGIKLKTKPVTVAVAAKVYHQFYEATSNDCYDPYLIAATSLYIASKDQDEPLKIRDLINVTHRVLNRDSEVLELSEEYWNFRDSIVQAELLIMRMINFKIPTPSSHFHLLAYLRSLEAWIPIQIWKGVTLPKLCWTMLLDFHLNKIINQVEPQLVALAVISLALQIYGIQIPCTTEQDQKPWHEVFHPTAKKEVIWNLIDHLLVTYEQEKEQIP